MLPIYPSTESREDKKITQKEVMDKFKEGFVLYSNFVYMSKKNGKYSFYINDAEGAPYWRIITFRIGRSFKPEERENIEFYELSKRDADAKPLYDIVLVPSKSDVIEMCSDLKDVARISKGYIVGVGSVWNWGGSSNDVDVVIKSRNDEEFDKIVSVLNEKAEDIRDYCSYHEISDSLLGVFTNHQYIYDLALVPSVTYAEKNFTRLSKFKLFTYSFFEKPLGGRYPSSAYNYDDLLKIVNENWDLSKGVWVGCKRDGATVRVDWKDSRVRIVTEEGRDVTNNLPTLVEELSKRKDSGSIIGELELYIDGKHQSRADSSAVMNHLDIENEKYMRLTIYDLFYLNGKEYHPLPYTIRRNNLSKIKQTKHVVISNPEYLVTDEKSLISAIKRTSSIKYSEGSMLKYAISPYRFKIHFSPPHMIKWKNTFNIVVRVLKKQKVKDANAWVYTVGVDGIKSPTTLLTKNERKN